MFWLKRCPRCCGDLYEGCDQFGPFIACMQCGLMRDVLEDSAAPWAVPAEPPPAPSLPPAEGNRRRRRSHGGRHTGKLLPPRGAPAGKVVA